MALLKVHLKKKRTQTYAAGALRTAFINTDRLESLRGTNLNQDSRFILRRNFSDTPTLHWDITVDETLSELNAAVGVAAPAGSIILTLDAGGTKEVPISKIVMGEEIAGGLVMVEVESLFANAGGTGAGARRYPASQLRVTDTIDEILAMSQILGAGGTNGAGLGILGSFRGVYDYTRMSTTFDFVAADVSVADNTISEPNHGLKDGTPVRLVNAGGALPTGLAAATTYYVVGATEDLFQLSATEGGAAINITGAGTGVQTLRSNHIGRIKLGVTLPEGAIIMRAFVNVLIQPTSGGLAEAAFEFENGTEDILAAEVVTGITVGITSSLILMDDKTSWVTITAEPENQLVMDVTVDILDAGKLEVIGFYYVPIS